MSEARKTHWVNADLSSIPNNLYALAMLDFDHITFAQDTNGVPLVGRIKAQRVMTNFSTLVTESKEVLAHAGVFYHGALAENGIAIEKQFAISIAAPRFISPEDGFDVIVTGAAETEDRSIHAISTSLDDEGGVIRSMGEWLRENTPTESAAAFSARRARIGIIANHIPGDGGVEFARHLHSISQVVTSGREEDK